MRSIRSFERFDLFKNVMDEFGSVLDVVIISESLNITIAYPVMKVFSVVEIMDPLEEELRSLLKSFLNLELST